MIIAVQWEEESPGKDCRGLKLAELERTNVNLVYRDVLRETPKI